MVEMSCQEHDKLAAGSQFMTHTVGRVLDMLGLESTPINTKGYETLLDLVENTCEDSFDLYYGLFLYNKSALEMVERLDLAFDALRNELFGRLHHVVRKQLFEKGEKVKSVHDCSYQNGAALAFSSNALRYFLDFTFVSLIFVQFNMHGIDSNNSFSLYSEDFLCQLKVNKENHREFRIFLGCTGCLWLMLLF